MKKLFRILAITAFITLIIAAVTLLIPSAASNDVIYIASNGKGTGASPASPLGNNAGYKPGNKMETQTAFYKALDKLKDTGGTVVIVGEVSIDCTEARFPEKKGDTAAPCEFRIPKCKSGVKITITSVYNNVDYRTKGAKLILDYDTCNTTTVMFRCHTTLEKLNIEYRYHEDYPNSWKTPFMIGGGGYNFVIGEEVNVSSVNTKNNSAGNQYPMLLGGNRYSNIDTGTNLVINSGTWSRVIAGSCGIGTNASYGEVKGNASLVINGGKIGTVVGTGEPTQPSNSVHGSLTMTFTGGEVGEVYISHKVPFPGKRVEISITKNAKIGKFEYTTGGYLGSLKDLVEIVNIRNASSLKITAPDIAVQTAAPDIEETNTEPKPQAPEETKKEYEYDPELGMDFPVIPAVIWIMLIVVAAVILAATIIINKIKLDRLG